MVGGARDRAVPLRWFLPVAATLTAVSASVASAASLWKDGNLLAGPSIAPGETVTIVLDDGAGPACVKGILSGAVAARVVKVLPNTNLVLEARVAAGDGYVLLGGEVARAHLRPGRRAPVSRVARLAVVARGLDADSLGPLLGAVAEQGGRQ